ncbi:lipopolysaccharide heptosyltransferase II [Candidatus Sumerlaeota bacterium]|nr:lipopolysaccharide heptosyltransferase II [Candidatus Sumerlaeota bacterium]
MSGIHFKRTALGESILIIKLSAIGDVIHTLPCLDALRRAKPDARIAWLVQAPSDQLLRGHPQLDEVLLYPRKEWSAPLGFMRGVAPFRRMLRERRFDAAIDFQGLTKSGFLAWLSGAPRRIGFGDADGKREFNGLFINEPVSPAPDEKNIIKRNLALLRPLGIEAKAREARAVLQPPDAALEAIEAFWREQGLRDGARLIGLNPGAGWPTKQWPLEHFARIGARAEREFGRRALIFWGPGEREMAEEIARQMQEAGASPVIGPRTSLMELAALLMRCAAFVAGDTGPLHMAAALGVPCVALFGASDGERNGPLSSDSRTLQNCGLDCVPCWKRRCNHSSAFCECMASLHPDAVFEALRDLLME